MLRIRGERADNIELAITHFQRVVEIQPRDTLPTRWAHTMSNLGSAYLSRIYGKQADNLGQAINYLQLSAEVLTCEDFPYSWANIQERLGDVYVKYNVGQPADNINQVTIHYQNALEVYTNMELPVKYRDTLNTIGNVYFEKRYWKDAYAAYNKAIDTSEAVFAEAYTEKGRQKEINQISQLYVRTAYCLLHLGEPAKALLLLEQGKVRLITEALALDSARLAALPQTQQQFIQVMRRTVHELEAEQRLPSGTPARRTNAELGDLLRQARTSLHQSIETIRTNYPESIFVGLDLPKTLALVPTGGALIVPMVTSQGSAVFVLPHGLEEITTDHVIWLNAFNEGELQHISVGTEIEQGWLLTYLTESLTEWIAGIETFTARIWQTLMGPIHEQLVRLGLSEGAPAIIIPQGGLGLLPLHSAWHIMDGVKRSFLDYYTVSYIPSANILSVCQQRAQDVQRHQHTLLEVIDPTADLLCTSVEGAAVGALFGSNASRIFIGNEATKEAVIAEIKEANYNYLHFSCHGFYNWGEDVMGSGLMLAGSNLTLSEIVSPEFNLHSTRLVTLSACESGLTEALELPDEYIGLPTGFLQAGAPAVVSTLWAVNDFSTALLMQEFYHRYLVEGQTIAQALRSAQLWLRQTTAEDLELAKYWEQIYQASGKTNVDAFRAMRYYQARPNDRPFSHPYYWAAFMHIGV